jgi:hypothetical protein
LRDGPVVPCPACGRKIAYSQLNRWRPFCSERCRTVDLGAWASERFRIAGAPPAGEESGIEPQGSDSA